MAELRSMATFRGIGSGRAIVFFFSPNLGFRKIVLLHLVYLLYILVSIYEDSNPMLCGGGCANLCAAM